MRSISVTMVELGEGDELRISLTGFRDDQATLWLLTPDQYLDLRESLTEGRGIETVEVDRLLTVPTAVPTRIVRGLAPGVWFLAWSGEDVDGVRVDARRTGAFVPGGVG